jgi:membrane fusion protein, multidrug efflux system
MHLVCDLTPSMNYKREYLPSNRESACYPLVPRRLDSATFGLAFMAAVAAFALCGCKKDAPTQLPPPEVEVVAVEQRDVPIYRDWVGTLQSEVNATISAQVTGYLLSRDYKEGSIVTNGQVLFRIDPAPFKAALDQAQAQLAQSKATEEKYALNVKRYRPLAAKEAISQQELDDAIQNQKATQAKVESDQAAVKQAELNLGFTTICSPVDGIAGLASPQAQVGNLVGQNSGPLTTVTTVDPIRAYVSVSQALMTEMMQRNIAQGKDLRTVDNAEGGTELELVLADGQTYLPKGRVRFANNQVDVKTGTIRVVGEFANPKRLLVPGMFVRVRALLETLKGALLVPQRAVTDMQGRSLVAVVGADNKVSIHPVDLVDRVGPNCVVKGNLKAGDRVVAEGIQKVRDGLAVKPVPFAEKAAATSPPAPAAKAEAKKD